MSNENVYNLRVNGKVNIDEVESDESSINKLNVNQLSANMLSVDELSANDFSWGESNAKLEKLIMDIVYPVGSIYITLNKLTNQQDEYFIWHDCKWEIIEKGLFLRNGDLETSSGGEKGGNEKHTHTLDNAAACIHPFWYTSSNFTGGGTAALLKQTDQWTTSYIDLYSGGGMQNNSQENSGTKLMGSTDETSNIPPYLTVWMYKRVE